MFKEYREFQEELKPKGPPRVYKDNGKILQCNQGGYEWSFNESADKTCIIFELGVPRFMDTSLLDVDLQPKYVRVTVKDKITQLSFAEEILVERTTVQRSSITGQLVLTCPKARISEIEARNMRIGVAAEEKLKKQ